MITSSTINATPPKIVPNATMPPAAMQTNTANANKIKQNVTMFSFLLIKYSINKIASAL